MGKRAFPPLPTRPQLVAVYPALFCNNGRNSFLPKELEKVGGLWTTNEEVDKGLAKLVTTPRNANKVKLDAIKTQINHHKKVLDQKFSASCGYFFTKQ